MSKNEETMLVLTPRGRVVGGDVTGRYDRSDKKGNPMFKDDGVTRKTSVFIALAIPKDDPKIDGVLKKIKEFAHEACGIPLTSRRKISYKIKDGDSQEVNTKDVAFCDNEGWPGHWIIECSSPMPWHPKILDQNSQDWVPGEKIFRGDYVRIVLELKHNGSQDTPGIFVSPKTVQYLDEGKRIAVVNRVDAADELSELEGASEGAAAAAKPNRPPAVKDFGAVRPPGAPAAGPTDGGSVKLIGPDGKIYSKDALLGMGMDQAALDRAGYVVQSPGPDDEIPF